MAEEWPVPWEPAHGKRVDNVSVVPATVTISGENPEIQDKVILALERQRKFDVAIKEREEVTGNIADRAKFKTPSLRNVGLHSNS